MRLHRAWHGPAMLLTAALAGCTGSVCKNVATAGAPSPDGKFIAFVFNRSCSGAPAVSTHVSVIRFSESLRNETGNVLVVDGLQPLTLSWLSPTDLVVRHVKDPRLAHPKPVDSVTVEFRQ